MMEVAAKIVHTSQACISVYRRVNMVIINAWSSYKDCICKPGEYFCIKLSEHGYNLSL